MTIRDRRAIHRRAGEALTAAPGNPGKIALCYAAVCAVLALISSILDVTLSNRIADTGGLSNMGLRSILSTCQTVLPLIQLVVTSCLGLGYHICALRISRGSDARPGTLLEGFRNFGPVLRAVFFQALLYLSFGIVSLYLSSLIFMATPYAEPFIEVMGPLLESPELVTSGQLVLDDATVLAAMDTLIPMIWIWLGLFLLMFLPAYYGYRMTLFCIADEPRRGALASMHMSKKMLRRNRIALLRLDLSMWWFYALQILVSLVCYGEILLPLVGVTLPWSPVFSYYFFFAVSLALQVVGYYFLMNRVNVAYAVAYDTLLPKEQEAPEEPDLPFPTQY